MLALRRLATLALLGLAALAAEGCLSPTLPLPPPEDPDVIHQETSGDWLVAGSCRDRSIVLVFNNTRGAGEARECTHGTYAVTIPGKKCDRGFINEQFADGEDTAPTEFVLQEISGGTPSGGICK